jgi:ABC-type dipeptide/oligopeptide/nickel transport system permease subunit
MTGLRRAAAIFLIAVVAISIGAGMLAPHDYSTQFRDHAGERPSRAFLLGTDDLGRDRFSRLLYATRISLLLAPVTALLSIAIAAAIGLSSGYFGGWLDRIAVGSMDLFLSLPWLFLLLTLRAMLPLSTSSWTSLTVTFLLLALVGWAAGARVIRANVAVLRATPAMVQARAYGSSSPRLLFFHLLPNLKPVLSAQFWILVPIFLLTEANLGVLGLGVSEPLPSWGNMLAELQNYQRIPEAPWILAPAVLLALVVASLHFVVSGTKTWE